MYVLAPGQTIKVFPYSFADLRRDNPNTSFPRQPSDELLASFDVFRVKDTPLPSYDFATQDIVQGNPTLNGSEWIQTWVVLDLGVDEVTERLQNKANLVRDDRNKRLADCDWTQLADSPLDADAKLAWQLYRETLRMVPQQAGFPWNVEWPPVPGS